MYNLTNLAKVLNFSNQHSKGNCTIEKVDIGQVDHLKLPESSRIETNESKSNKNDKELMENQSSNDLSYNSKESKGIMVLFIIKLKNIKKIRDNKNTMKEGVEWLVELVEKWADKGFISGVIDKDRLIKREEFKDIKI